jgi:hypothetical protein
VRSGAIEAVCGLLGKGLDRMAEPFGFVADPDLLQRVPIQMQMMSRIAKECTYVLHRLAAKSAAAKVSDDRSVRAARPRTIHTQRCFICATPSPSPHPQAKIQASGGVSGLVRMLDRLFTPGLCNRPASARCLALRAMDALVGVMHNNAAAKEAVRDAGGIPVLARLLVEHCDDTGLAATAVRTLRMAVYEHEANMVRPGHVSRDATGDGTGRMT